MKADYSGNDFTGMHIDAGGGSRKPSIDTPGPPSDPDREISAARSGITAGCALMFIFDFVYVELPWDTVAERIMRSEGSWLEPLVLASRQDGEDLRIRVGLGGKDCWFGKEVRIKVSPPRKRHGWLVLTMTWDAVGAEAMFPHLEADLEVAPVGEGCTQISLRGRYDPPLGRTGEFLDASVLHRVAEATVRCFLRRIAGTFTGEVPECSEEALPAEVSYLTAG